MYQTLFLTFSVIVVWCHGNDERNINSFSRMAMAKKNFNPPCELSETEASIPGFICKGQLLFEDNFTADLDKGKIWKPEIKIPGEPDYPFNVYLNDNHLKVNGNHLTIKPVTLDSIYGDDAVLRKLDLSEKCTGVIGTSECYRKAHGPQIVPPFVTAKITTKKSFSFKYGRIEVGARMPEGNWIVPEIQLEPRDHVYGSSNYASGLLRIACVKGNLFYSKNLYGGPILNGNEPLRSAHLKNITGNNRWSQKYHEYALEWRPDVIRLFVDGYIYGEVTPEGSFASGVNVTAVPAAEHWMKGTVMAPFDEMFYISLGVTIGGNNEFHYDETKPWIDHTSKAMLKFWNSRQTWYPWSINNALNIDYVRVFAL